MGSIPRVNTPPPVIDKTLSVEGAVADAMTTLLVLNPSSSASVLNDWFYTNMSKTINPYLHIFCIGV